MCPVIFILVIPIGLSIIAYYRIATKKVFESIALRILRTSSYEGSYSRIQKWIEYEFPNKLREKFDHISDGRLVIDFRDSFVIRIPVVKMIWMTDGSTVPSYRRLSQCIYRLLPEDVARDVNKDLCDWVKSLGSSKVGITQLDSCHKSGRCRHEIFLGIKFRNIVKVYDQFYPSSMWLDRIVLLTNDYYRGRKGSSKYLQIYCSDKEELDIVCNSTTYPVRRRIETVDGSEVYVVEVKLDKNILEWNL